MATLRKYNKELDRWENIASDDASGIYSDNPILTEDEAGNVMSIEDILLRYRAEIAKLQRNVAWLAKHGGGGSGGSGGSGGVNATLSVLDPADDVSEITSLVWSNDITHLSYKLTSNAKTTFTITIRLNNSVVQTDTITAKSYTGSISMSGIKKYLGTGGTLSITAVDQSESEFSTNCRLVVSSVTLNDSSLRVTRDQLANHEANPLKLTCRTNVLGKYRLYYCDSMIYVSGEDIFYYDENGNARSLKGSDTEQGSYISVDITDTNVTPINIDVVEKGLIVEDADPGTYNRYFLLVSESNILVRSSVAGSQLIVMVTEGILVSPQIGSINSPYTIAKDNILPVQFVVYSSNTGTYSYFISIDGVQVGSTVSGALFNTSITVPINIGTYDFIEPGNDYDLEITAFQGLIRETGRTKIKVLAASTSLPKKYLEDLRQHIIFDYTFYANPSLLYTNSNYYSRVTGKYNNVINSTLSLNHIGTDSGSTSVYYRFRHTAYGEVTTGGDNHWFAGTDHDDKCFIPKSNFQFTLQIAYHIEEEEDDDATILNLGNYNPSDNTGHGILITSHKLYIALEKTTLSEDLQDNDFTQLDIVSEQSSDGNYWLRVYQNARLLSSTIFDLDNGGTSGSQNLSKFIIGCKGITNNLTTDSINLDLYSIKFFSKSLNVGQVICSYINNFANYNMTENGLPAELVTQLCENNQILTGEDETKIDDTSKISAIYNFKEGEYTWNISSTGNVITLPDSIKKLPIPVVTVSVADAGWTFDGFIAGSYNNSPATNCLLTYKSGRSKSTQYISDLSVESLVTVSIQGTTSANYSIKNINITFPDNVLFSPISTWFPENTFTLKADIVDSGHINNAVIGKFVNECFNSNPGNLLMNVDRCFPTVSKVRTLKSREQLPPDLTVKATIEGFPVLLVMNFKSGDTRDVRILGVYSFNLGRESYYNQGYKVPNHLYPVGSSVPYTVMSQIQFPSLFGTPPSTDIDINTPGYCYEGQASHNCSVTKVPFSTQQYDYAEIDMGKSKKYYPALETTADGKIKYGSQILVDDYGKEIPYNQSKVSKYKIEPNGYFWSTHDTYTTSLWKFVADPSILNINEANRSFQALNNCIATEIPYRKGTVSQSYGAVVEQYQISATGETIVSSKTGSNFTLRAAQSDAEPVLLSIQNTAFYYVIAMLFGLVDSLGKNLQMKYWGNGGSQFWSPTFYDMDTALGIDNTGKITVTPNALDYSIFNTQENKAQPMFGALPNGQTDISLFTVYSNKLWGIENPDFVRQYSQDFTVSSSNPDNMNANFFAQMWHNLRTTMIKSADEFFESYFAHQFDGCGEFLMNYDYQVKYLDTSEVSYLHGNRLSFIKNWLEKRIDFLDSVFGFVQRIQNGTDYALTNYLEVPSSKSVLDINAYNVPWKNQVIIKHNSGSLTIPVKTNRDVIMRVNVGGVNTSYTYVPSGKKTNIIVAEGVGTLGIQTSINNSSCITEIDGLKTLELTEVSPRSSTTVYDSSGNVKYNSDSTGNLRTQWGSFASLKKLDLSGLTTLYSNIDFFRLFKTWDTSVLNGSLGSIDPNYFSLHTLDLSGMTTGGNLSVNLGGMSGVNIPEPYKKPFINLSSINLSNSDVSNVTIPGDVSLSYLNLNNSRIANLSLSNQPLLGSISFYGCRNLSVLTLSNCNNFTDLSFDNTNVSLNQITISGNESLRSFRITPGGNNSYEHVPEVTIQDCPNLTTISITNCINKTEGDSCVLKITGCPNLKTIDLTRSKYKTIIWDKATNEESGKVKLTSLQLNESTVSVIRKPESSVTIMDLTDISSIDALNLASNSDVEHISFDNIKNSPIVISTSKAFFDCTSLKRVYGNIEIVGSNAFNNCTNFSVLGNTTTYGSISMLESSTGRIKHFFDSDIRDSVLDSNGLPNFLSGSGVTNLRLTGSAAGSYAFQNTNCNILDVYYILFGIGQSVTNINGIFYQCGNVGWSWDNSPSRYTFKNCNNVTTASQAFRATNSSRFKLYSPTTDDSGNYNNDGFFSGLSKCTNISAILLGNSYYVIDRHLFRRSSGSNYAITNMDYFYPSLVIDNINTYTGNIDGLVSVFGNVDRLRADAESDDPKYGNLGGFFTNLTSLTSMNGIFNGTGFINYDLFTDSNRLRIPTGVKTLRLAFRSVYSYGTISYFDYLFEKLGTSYPTLGIYSSFITTNGSLRGTLEITDGLFYGFDNIVGIGYYNDSSDFNSGERSFNGLKKTIVQSYFPYNIVPNRQGISRFQGVFEGASFADEYKPEQGTEIQLPYDMFRGCPNLISTSYLFYNFGNDYRLTSESFTDCTRLADVGLMFACSADDTTRTVKNHLCGPIPNKLFYHGEVSKTLEIVGLYEDDNRAQMIPTVDNGVFTISGNSATATWTEANEPDRKVVHNYTYGGFIVSTLLENTIICVPTTSVVDVRVETTINRTYNPDTGEYEETSSSTSTTSRYQFGDSIELADTDKITINYSIPNATISYMTNCFRGADIESYKHQSYTTLEEENLSTYQPFNYVKKDGRWTQETPNLKKKTLMWVYDGFLSSYQDYIGDSEEYEYLDDAQSFSEGNIYYPRKGGETTSNANEGYFCCAPDLLRYCTSDANIEGMFSFCGQVNGNSTTYNQLYNLVGSPKCYNYGLHGRIVPYLFKPTPRVTNLSNFFLGCKLLGWYTIGDQNYTIPQSLFSYITSSSLNLTAMFEAVHFPEKISLDVFKDVTRSMNVTNIFRYACYDADSSNWITISNVFNDSKIRVSGLNSAFRISRNDSETDAGEPIAMIRSVYVKFLDNFKSGYFPADDAKFVYDGYSRGTVDFGETKELPTEDGRRNYRTVG